MSDALEKPAGSSLAVVEKKPQRHGGCVGIFFQLFDWNRRFAKKKLFSKKLLPPADRLKQSSKKFGGDEKQPRIRLIADENKGGFPNVKNTNGGGSNPVADQKHEMRVPGLVARLMGLETMPAVHRDKLKKTASRGSPSEELFEREELSVEKGGGPKHELRPPKLQKTSVSERQAVTKFGAEKLPQFKNVLSKTRKHNHHHPKLPTPVKSPRSGLRKSSSSRLIGAAARILEPGLQTSRSKSMLTYPNHLDHPMRNVAMESTGHSFPSQPKGCEGLCRNCGYLLNNLDPKPMESERPVVFASPESQCVRPSCQWSETTMPGCSYQELEDESCEAHPAFAATEVNNVQPHVLFAPYKIPLSEQGMPVAFGSNRSGNQVLYSRDGLISGKEPRALAGNRTKNMIRVPARRDSNKFNKFNSEKRIPDRVNDMVPLGQKRRPGSISRHGESSSIDAQIYGFPQPVMGKQPGYNAHLINQQCGRNRSTADNFPMGNNVVSSAHNSSMKLKSDVSERKVKNNVHFAESLHQSAMGGNSRRKRLEKPFPLSEDALGALLEQKLKELTHQGEDIGGGTPKQTTAMILHELISALTSETPFQQQDNLPSISDERNCWRNHSRLPVLSSSKKSQATMASKPYVDQQLDSEHLSPGSVLEAYLSMESCPASSSMDDCHGYKSHSESIEYSHDRKPWPNSEPLDSAASIRRPESSKELVINVLNNVSETLCCSRHANYGLNRSDLEQAKEVLTNAELALHSGAGRVSPVKLIRDQLEALTTVLWMNFGCSLGIEDGKETNRLTRFVFDSVIEHLGLTMSKMLGKSQPRTNGKMLMFEILEAVRKWEEMSRYGLDEVIGKEMDRSLGDWTQCESEVSETGVEISRCLYDNLVNEVAMDLSRLGS